MNAKLLRSIGRLYWADLAATDLDAATGFYARIFRWTTSTQRLDEGAFRVFAVDRQVMASGYQLGGRHLAASVPSHWTPYFSVADVAASARDAEAAGATVVVRPFAVPGTARIALIQDPVGATFGLWEAPASEGEWE